MWWELMAMDRQGLSDLAGSASFFVWLFAQSPQLYENYRNSSCEGLSIVFLLQWMTGDLTNLIGCLLTQQLPFQIAVATYFCSIDTCILAQYYYYWRRDARLARQGARETNHTRYASVTAPNMRSSSTHASIVRDSRNGRNSPGTSLYRGSTSRPSMLPSYDSSSSFHTQSARSVADLASEYARRAAKRDAARQERWNRKAKEAQGRERNGKHTKQGTASSGGEEEGYDRVPGNMQDSLLSDSSQGSEAFGYGFGSASTMIEPVKRELPPLPTSPTSNIRGRDMTRTAGKIAAALSTSRSPQHDAIAVVGASSEQTGERPLSALTALPLEMPSAESTFRAAPKRKKKGSSSISRRSSSRGAGIVLLGMTALFGLNDRTFTNNTRSIATSMSEGRAVAAPLWKSANALQIDSRPEIIMYLTPSTSFHRHHLPPPPPLTWERIVGRISAWICTVLYMTSRLPQIWTNLSRKSVQGLSILLFMAAATGNALYSISILINPLASGPDRYEYISESLPFLLGSGGTLIFDAIIVMQWIAWRGMAPVVETSHSRSTSTVYYHRSSSRNQNASRQRWTSLERQPLLD